MNKKLKYLILIIFLVAIINIILEIIFYNLFPRMFYYYNLPFLKVFDKFPIAIQNIFIYSNKQTDLLFVSNIITIVTIQIMILATLIGLIYIWFKRQKTPTFK